MKNKKSLGQIAFEAHNEMEGAGSLSLWEYETIAKAVEREVKRRMNEKQVEIHVVASEGPSLGACLKGEVDDGIARICLNLKLGLLNDKDQKG